MKKYKGYEPAWWRKAVEPIEFSATLNCTSLSDDMKRTIFGLPAEREEVVTMRKIAPVRIQKNGPATIVFWNDGSKTVVKRGTDEPDSDYAAFTAALGIKIYGSNSKLKKIVGMAEEQKAVGNGK